MKSVTPQVAIVLVSHPGIASAMHQQAAEILGQSLEEIHVIELHSGLKAQTGKLASTLNGDDNGSGVLILTDLPGATPCNFARQAAPRNSRVVSGLNLPMLIRVWNYRGRPLEELSALAEEGGRVAIKELN